MHWFILDTIIFGGEVLGIDVNRMVTSIATYFNDPNPDWAILCTNCPAEYLITFDTLTDPDWDVFGFNSSAVTVVTPNVLQSNEEGNPIPAFKCAWVTSSPFEGINGGARIEFDSVQSVRQVNFDYHFIKPSNNVLNRTIQLLDNVGGTIATWTTSADNAIKDEWTTISRPFFADNVKEVIVSISVVGDPAELSPANTQGFIDNVRIQIGS